MRRRRATSNRAERTSTWKGPALAALALVATTRMLLRAKRRIAFTGRNVVITGGSRGLGLVLARELIAQGATVILIARDAAELERASAGLSQGKARVKTFVCDVGDATDVGRAMDAVTRELGAIDVLINNAGVIEVGPGDTMTHEDYAAALRTHFWGPLHTTEAVAPAMRRRRFGRIVNIASIGGKISVPHLLPYSASKFALVGLSEGLRAEFMRDNVFVTTVCPGLMRTGSPRNVTVKGQYEAEYAWFAISDSLPVMSVAAERAARRIVHACRYGEAEVIVGTPARIAAILHGLFPGATANALSLVNRLLPRADGGDTTARTGAESSSALAPSPLTTLSDKAARKNNELRGMGNG